MTLVDLKERIVLGEPLTPDERNFVLDCINGIEKELVDARVEIKNCHAKIDKFRAGKSVEFFADLERKAEERDALYWHLHALVELLTNLRFQPVATYAAAYLTQIVPPDLKSDLGPTEGDNK